MCLCLWNHILLFHYPISNSLKRAEPIHFEGKSNGQSSQKTSTNTYKPGGKAKVPVSGVQFEGSGWRCGGWEAYLAL